MVELGARRPGGPFVAAVLVAAAPLFGAAPLLAQARLLAPTWMTAALDLRAMIRTPSFETLARRDGPAAVDTIFAAALEATGGAIAPALLACTAACFDHRVIRVRFGLFDLPLPLALESRGDADSTAAHLPRQLFFDSPPEGDRDKLQHFFGSAWVQFVTRIDPIATAVGGFVEAAEPTLVEGGTNDPRDLRADRAGQAFALLLGDRGYVPPDRILRRVR